MEYTYQQVNTSDEEIASASDEGSVIETEEEQSE